MSRQSTQGGEFTGVIRYAVKATSQKMPSQIFE